MIEHRPFPPIENVTSKQCRNFFLKFHRQEPNKCWLWIGTLRPNVSGELYGQFNLNGGQYKAHRVQYFLTTGVDPGEKEVCHKCDVTFCVNPSHLFLGTHSDNQKDSFQKRRHSHEGTDNPRAKLTVEDVKMIRESNESDAILSKHFRVSRKTIYGARNGKNWSNI